MTSPGKEQMTTGLDVEELERKALAATPGPWGWFGNAGSQSIYLATVNRGRQFVMKFARWGMRGSQPRFQVNGRMTNASELMEFEVCRAIGDAAAKKDPDCYRLDVTGIAHPDAIHISTFSPEVVLSLIARMKATEAALAFKDQTNAALQAHMGKTLPAGCVAVCSRYSLNDCVDYVGRHDKAAAAKECGVFACPLRPTPTKQEIEP
jgi:hypothetical protein